MSNASVSVCLATWNGAPYVKDQIESVLVQLRNGDELVVSDDGSTDGTLNILQSYKDRLVMAGHIRAGGVVPNFERALRYARGDIIVLCDQDDVWLPNRLELVRKQLLKYDLVMLNGDVVDKDLQPIGKDVLQFVGFRAGLLQNFISTSYVGACMAFKREVLTLALPFPSHIFCHDWYIALVSHLLFSCTIETEKTMLFRRHSSNASATGKPSPNSWFKKILMRFWMIRALLIVLIRGVIGHNIGRNTKF